MDDAQTERLFELADLILAVSRHIHASKDTGGETWTPLESSVMRFIDRNPGTSPREAAEATQLISSNFSRAVRALEKKGLVRREVDEQDARRARLYPTRKAQENLRQLREVWSRLLDGVLDDPAEIAATTATLQRIETRLVSRPR
ncbi:MarR family winged helix-turn-helix transcriptional regulator [Actinoplanes sp. HUAS TT8]|uniref:MarR family winged helix-turn-helix transcriptional regulator n=1 Tax=Actinoplanes sp. HUAS TT8 TaxID=3447453 RepID=UPI003F524141